MPNWCFTEIAIEGEKNAITAISAGLDECKRRSRTESDFGNLWEGAILNYFGYNVHRSYPFRFRGSIDFYEKECDTVLRIEQSDAWAPNIDMWREIIKKTGFEADIYYRATEPGCGLYITNDDSGLYFPGSWIFEFQVDENDIPELSLRANDEGRLYENSDSEMIDSINRLMKKEFKSIPEIEEELKKYFDSFCYCQLYSYEYTDE